MQLKHVNLGVFIVTEEHAIIVSFIAVILYKLAETLSAWQLYIHIITCIQLVRGSIEFTPMRDKKGEILIKL